MEHAESTLFAPAARKSPEEVDREWRFLADTPLLGRLLDTVPIGMLVLNDCRQIVHANRTMAAIVGCSEPHSLAGARPGEAVGCIHADSRPEGCGTTEFCRECGAVRAILTAQEGTPDVQECRITLKNGESLDLQVHTVPFALKGATFTLFCVLDLSHEKRRRVLERIFFHDVLNTAGGLYGVADLMSGTLPRTDQSVRFVHAVHSLSRSIIEEIEAQKVLAAAEHSDLPMHPLPLQSITLLEETAEAYEHHEVAHEKMVVVDADSLSCGFVCDHMLIKRVLGNLVKNALEASRAGECVTLRCLDGGEGSVAFEVHNPTFMPRNVQLQIFNRSFSTKGAGRGVGTYSIRLLTEKYLGGTVGFTTSEAFGTTFRITIPLAAAGGGAARGAIPGAGAPGEGLVDLRGARLLVVEDNEINQQIAAELLGRAGARVEIAGNGRVAVEMACAKPYDLVLMDLHMPDMDGLEATGAIRAIPRLAGLPIVAMTADDEPEEVRRCLDAGMNGHVTKPLDPPTLLATVARYHRPALRPGGEGAAVPVPREGEGGGATWLEGEGLRPEVGGTDGIPQVEGLDTAEGLLRVARNESLYLRLLRQFVSEQGETAAHLRDLVAEGQLVPATLLAHSVKGVAGNIGATQVHKAAARVERALGHAQEPAEIEEALAELTSLLSRFVGDLARVLGPGRGQATPAAPETGGVDESRVREVLDELERLLAEFEPGACECFESHREMLRAWWPDERFEAFADCIARYELGEALPLLQAAAGH